MILLKGIPLSEWRVHIEQDSTPPIQIDEELGTWYISALSDALDMIEEITEENQMLSGALDNGPK